MSVRSPGGGVALDFRSLGISHLAAPERAINDLVARQEMDEIIRHTPPMVVLSLHINEGPIYIET